MAFEPTQTSRAGLNTAVLSTTVGNDVAENGAQQQSIVWKQLAIVRDIGSAPCRFRAPLQRRDCTGARTECNYQAWDLPLIASLSLKMLLAPVIKPRLKSDFIGSSVSGGKLLMLEEMK